MQDTGNPGQRVGCLVMEIGGGDMLAGRSGMRRGMTAPFQSRFVSVVTPGASSGGRGPPDKHLPQGEAPLAVSCLESTPHPQVFQGHAHHVGTVFIPREALLSKTKWKHQGLLNPAHLENTIFHFLWVVRGPFFFP